jgi:hypothetical protein
MLLLLPRLGLSGRNEAGVQGVELAAGGRLSSRMRGTPHPSLDAAGVRDLLRKPPVQVAAGTVEAASAHVASLSTASF